MADNNAPRAIFIFSDGTGNSAGKVRKTNVWRLYNALDLKRPDQIAFYDDGVGTENFKPLMILGGAFGFGLKWNVIELYKNLCSVYRPGDSIFLFGFSRGAFTVRMLVGLISHGGLIDNARELDPAALHRQARARFGAFRGSFRKQRKHKNQPGPPAADAPRIAFVGVWDTVDAYGLPVDELTAVLDKVVPLRFPDQRLSRIVDHACHAVALDDERHTFHPVMWDQSREEDRERIEQVWFAGVHSNVGGGYPDDGMSEVSLNWMITRLERELKKRGETDEQVASRFIPGERDCIRAHSDENGKLYDSRSGVFAYYRYRPRRMDELCNDAVNEVSVDRRMVHQSVLNRIRNVSSYAPVSVAGAVTFVDDAGNAAVEETQGARERRTAKLESAWNVVFWRRGLYFALLALTLTVLASPLFLDWAMGATCRGRYSCLGDPVLRGMSALLPDIAASWFEALRQNPWWMLGFAVAFGVLFYLRRLASTATRRRAADAWRELLSGDMPATREAGRDDK